jgi:hypothetical protein
MFEIAGHYQQDGQERMAIMSDRIAHSVLTPTSPGAMTIGSRYIVAIGSSRSSTCPLRPISHCPCVLTRADALRRLIQDVRVGREKRAKQIWQPETLSCGPDHAVDGRAA